VQEGENLVDVALRVKCKIPIVIRDVSSYYRDVYTCDKEDKYSTPLKRRTAISDTAPGRPHHSPEPHKRLRLCEDGATTTVDLISASSSSTTSSSLLSSSSSSASAYASLESYNCSRSTYNEAVAVTTPKARKMTLAALSSAAHEHLIGIRTNPPCIFLNNPTAIKESSCTEGEVHCRQRQHQLVINIDVSHPVIKCL